MLRARCKGERRGGLPQRSGRCAESAPCPSPRLVRGPALYNRMLPHLYARARALTVYCLSRSTIRLLEGGRGAPREARRASSAPTSLSALLSSSGEVAMQRRKTSRDTSHGPSPAPHPKRSARSSSAPVTGRCGTVDAEKRLSAAAATRLMLEKWDALDRRQDGRAQRCGSLPTHAESFELWAPEWEKFRLAQVQMEAQLDIEKNFITPPATETLHEYKETSSKQRRRRRTPCPSASTSQPTCSARPISDGTHVPTSSSGPHLVPYERVEVVANKTRPQSEQPRSSAGKHGATAASASKSSPETGKAREPPPPRRRETSSRPAQDATPSRRATDEASKHRKSTQQGAEQVEAGLPSCTVV
jgi:hypothetical protein